MRLSRKFPILLGCLALATGAFAGKKDDKAKKAADKLTEDGKKKDDPAATSDKKSKTAKGDGTGKPGAAADGDQGSGRMAFPLPEGRDAKGLVIPYRDGEAKKTMNFVVENAKRVDADHVQMKNLSIETYDADGKSDLSIDLPSSVLDLNTRVISTKVHVFIKRADFELTGETMEFNTETKQGTLGGNVRMLIYNLANETDEAAPAKPKEEAKAGE